MDERARLVLLEARSGRIDDAIASGEAILAGGARDAGLALFIGMLRCRQGNLLQGVDHLRLAVAFAPDELTPRIELARALLLIGDDEGAERLAAPLASTSTDAGREMQRIRAHAMMRLDQGSTAIALYKQLIDADDLDFESWAGLGNALLEEDAPSEAIEALRRATSLNANVGRHWITLARAYLGVSDLVAADDVARQAVRLSPNEPTAYLVSAAAAIGLRRHAEAAAHAAKAVSLASDSAMLLVEAAGIQAEAHALTAAEATYRAAIAIEPDLAAAWFGLGSLYERMNRSSDLTMLLKDAEDAAIPTQKLGMLHAKQLRREGRIREALDSARSASADIDPIGRSQLIGELADRCNDTRLAFSALSDAGTLLGTRARRSSVEGHAYRRTLDTLLELLMPEWYRSWPTALPTDGRRAPLFIFGFPRSGTTLIDTMLIGHPDTVVLEEEPVIEEMAEALGPVEQIPHLSYREIAALRALYFAKVARIVPDVGKRLIVDKNPLGLSSTPLLHRLFPDARFVFVERHPCDVVLSCFMNSSKFNTSMANFFDLFDTAHLYDRVMAYWTQCRSTLALNLHHVRYERLIASPERELRPLVTFAGLGWHDSLLTTEANAAGRSYIASPSYAQVAEPIYSRANGRWRRYEDEFKDVLPILKPWIDAMGYDHG